MSKINHYEVDLDKNAANYVPLTPIGFLERAAAVYPTRTAIIHGELRYTYAEAYARARRLASALAARGVGIGDTVSVMAPNTPPVLDAHFGVPMTGAVLNTLNIRLDAATIAFTLDHAETKVLITDREFSHVIKAALEIAKAKPLVIDIDDPQYTGRGERLGAIEYEDFIAAGDPDFAWTGPDDEWRAISLNYTSGTTGNPKGVVYHHRGAYLNAVDNIVSAGMTGKSVYLWTLPMFHCNGWCFTWSLAIVGGTHVCLRRVEAAAIYASIETYKVTHLCGAPIVMGMLINAGAEAKRPLPHPVELFTAAAPPPAAVIAAMEDNGFKITHLYGLTETYGPATICAWNEDWDALSTDEQAALKARQGVKSPLLAGLDVMDPGTMTPVPRDGLTMGEVMFRGNLVMKGYLRNPKASDEAFAGGWFHSGDLGVIHPDGYIQLRDRSKDIIISGGENISTIEVEDVLYKHPKILEAAVVARPDEKWGETPCAFINVKAGESLTEDEVIAFCKANLAGYKVPRTVVFEELPKTSTGKVQKFVLRDRAKAL
ncbi:acyl-CoA synthetase [Zavarzinia compransoris]|uniref:3-methylmercaptopropionyl-CoA ligase n=1 Tax=Zavarzinia compransoris TaxID=1264899 RepID=A0A317DWC3_9PROT|nr:acyl-CoA synthetase [Zavarzinia compransoris]PWR18831.1 acyl-CoA synthetase [Zavarzinia compransoris]TDP48819.1 fatty-acyl-CoA synthase [Zavarzinia compransoris]